jgi:hypothetical protein
MGEYDIDRVVELLDSGEFLWTDLCWTQGMAGWAPLSALRGEIAAAKAFPPVAAAAAPVASGRRLRQAPPAQPAASQANAPAASGWAWVVGGVTLGALVGLLTAHLFPNVVEVDRPVEKIVEKIVDRPVEVIRTVERRVDVPAALSAEQKAAEVFFRRFFDFNEHKKGNALFKVSNRVKVFTNFSGDGKYAVSEGLVRAKVESVFRSQGFKVLTEDSKESPYSIIDINGNILDSGSRPGISVSGSYSIEISQFVHFMSSSDDASPSTMVIKDAELTLYRKGGVLIYGSQHFGDIPEAYEKFAQQAAGELRKAYDN